MEIKKKGIFLILSAPSGAGKTTLKNEFLKINKNFKYSISYTTRQQRQGEISGVDYNFVSEEEFDKMIKNDMFLEYAEVHSNFYGTGKDILKEIDSGQDIILDIDVQGAMDVKEKYSEAVMVFILPPCWNALKSRLKGRNTDSDNVIAQRLDTAKKEIEVYKSYDYLLINDDIQNAVCRLNNIAKTETMKINRLNPDWEQFFNAVK